MVWMFMYTTILLLGLGFYVFILFLVSISLWVLIFQGFLFVGIFMILLFQFKKVNGGIGLSVNFSKFMHTYLTSEVLMEILVLLSYLTGWFEGFGLLGVFKLGVFPFFYYKHFLKGLSFKYFYMSFLTTVYFLVSKVWGVFLMTMFPYNYYNLLALTLFLAIYFLSSLEYDLKTVVFKSFILSNLMLVMMSQYLNLKVLWAYIILSSYFQFKVLFSYDSKHTFEEDYLQNLFHLTVLNGNLVYTFNFLKTLMIISLFEDLSLIMGGLLGGVSLVMLFFTMNIFLKEMMNLSICKASKFMFMVVSYMVLWMSTSQFLGSFEYDLFKDLQHMLINGVLDSSVGKSLKFLSGWVIKKVEGGSEIVSDFYYSYFLEVGLGGFMLGVITGMGKDFLVGCWISSGTKPISLEEVLGSFFFGDLNTMKKVLMAGGYFKDLIPTLMLLLPTTCILMSSNNSNILYEEGEKSTSNSYTTTMLQVMAFQWGWDMTYTTISPKYYILNLNLIEESLQVFGLELKSLTEDYFLKNMNHTSKVFSNNMTILIPGKSNLNMKTNSLDVLHAISSTDLGFKMDISKDKSLESSLTIFKSLGSEFDFVCYEYCGEGHSNMGGFFTTISNLESSFLLGGKS